MAREFAAPEGDNPQERRKKGRQMPPDSLRKHTGGDEDARAPREFLAKEIAETKSSLSPQEVFQRSYAEAQRLLNRQKDQLDDLSHANTTVRNLAEIEAMQGNLAAVCELGETLEESTDVDSSPHFIGVYLKASLRKDETATNKMHVLLQTEQETRMFIDEYEKPIMRSPGRILRTLVQACAEERAPADEWIDRYALDPDDKTELELAYLDRTARQPHADEETIARYQADVAEQFLQGTLTPQFAWDNVVNIYDFQKDEEQKKQIFRGFVDLFTDVRDSQALYDMRMFSIFCQLGENYLDDGYSSAAEARWIEATLGFLSKFIDREQNSSQVTYLTKQLKTSLERVSEPMPQRAPRRIIDKLDLLTGEQLNMAEGNNTLQKQALGSREDILWTYANKAVQEGDHAAAREYLSVIGSDNATAKYRAFFDLFETPQELAAVKPDALTLTYHDQLRTLFTATDIFLRGDTDEVAELTSSLLEERKPALQTGGELFPFLDGELFLKGIDTLYHCDNEAAPQVSSDMIREIQTLIKEKGIKSSKIMQGIAEIQLRHGDPSGWQLLSEHAEDNYPSEKLRLHAQLALRAARVMKEKGIPLEE